MDVALGVAVSGAVAHLALVGSGAHGVDVIDQSVIDVADSPVEKLAETVLGTNRLLAEDNHRLTATRVCWTDDAKVDELRRALESSGVVNVSVDSQADGATMAAEVGEDPTVALARGAALAAARSASLPDATMAAPTLSSGLTAEETWMVPAAQPPAGEVPLAYSMEREPAGEAGDGYYEADDTGKLPLSRRSLALGTAVIAFAVSGFASLAVAVVLANRPAASQQPVVGLQNAAPGKYMPLLPTRQQVPVPPPPPDAPNVGFQGGVVPDSNGYIPPQLIPPGQSATPPVAPVNPAPPEEPGNPPPGAPAIPAPVAPGGPQQPNPMPVPIPLPLPIPNPVPNPIPNPGWRPQPPPYVPPYRPPAEPTRPNSPPGRTAPPTHTETQHPTGEPQPTHTPETVAPRPTRPQHTMAPEPQHTDAPEPQHTSAPEPQHTSVPEPQQPRRGDHGGFGRP